MTAEIRLRQSIASTTDPLEKACLTAELAGYLARMGNFAGADTIIGELRASQNWDSPRLAALIMLAESIVALRNEYEPHAVDRLSRGYAIASGFGARGVAGLIASWLAHYNFNRGTHAELAQWVATATGYAGDMNRSAKARFCLTQAVIAATVNSLSDSEKWFWATRAHAVAMGDEAYLAAAMYNRSAFGIARVRWDIGRSQPIRDDLTQLGLEIDSAVNYSIATGNVSAPHLKNLWKGRLRLAQGNFVDALDLISNAVANLPEAVLPRIRIEIEADLAACQLGTGAISAAKEGLSRLPMDVDNIIPIEDRIAYYRHLKLLAEAVGTTADIDRATRHLQESIAGFDLVVARLAMCAVPFEVAWGTDGDSGSALQPSN
jgi:hypothetical protein